MVGVNRQSKYWLLTMNNPPMPFANPPLPLGTLAAVVDFGVYQLEIGEQGTPHLQIYICFGVRQRENRVRQLFPGCHCEARRGNHREVFLFLL